jgi:hypothetical protein
MLSEPEHAKLLTKIPELPGLLHPTPPLCCLIASRERLAHHPVSQSFFPKPKVVTEQSTHLTRRRRIALESYLLMLSSLISGPSHTSLPIETHSPIDRNSDDGSIVVRSRPCSKNNLREDRAATQPRDPRSLSGVILCHPSIYFLRCGRERRREREHCIDSLIYVFERVAWTLLALSRCCNREYV